MRVDHNERVEVRELRGSAASDLRGALADMEAFAAGTQCKKPLYHASINTRADERLTEEQRGIAIDRLEKALGLKGQPRAVVVHEKLGREHTHIVWARANPERGTVISDSHNFRKHEATARQLEREFGYEVVPGAHVGRRGRERPERTPGHGEMQQAARTGLNPSDARAQITALWRSTTTGQAFAAALKDAGWCLARGDRRDLVLIDGTGNVHGLARRIEGASAANIRARLSDIDPATLPSVAEARAAIRVTSSGSAGVVKFPGRGVARSAADITRHHDRGRPQRQAA